MFSKSDSQINIGMNRGWGKKPKENRFLELEMKSHPKKKREKTRLENEKRSLCFRDVTHSIGEIYSLKRKRWISLIFVA